MNSKEHLLACLAEECAEVQHAVGKALRFGLQDGYVRDGDKIVTTNAEQIMMEIVDLIAIVDMLTDADILTAIDPTDAIKAKREKVYKWMAHAKTLGTVVD